MNERVKFPKNAQRAFLQLVRTKTKLNWNELSRICSTKKETLRSFYYEKRTLPYVLAKLLSELIRIELPKVQILPSNWGPLKAGKLNFKNIKVNTKSKEFAEVIGILLGDGHLSKDGRTIGIYLNNHDEKDYAKYVIELLDMQNILPKLKMRQSKIEIMIYSKAVHDTLSQIGMSIGNKLHGKTKIPDYIIKNKQLLIPCLRGLFDSDGSISLCRKTLQVYFSNYSKTLLDSFNEGLINLGFNPCLTNKSVILYANQANTFLDIVGTRNPKNIAKLDRIKEITLKGN